MASFAETHDTTVTILLKEGTGVQKSSGEEFERFGIESLDRLIARVAQMGVNAWDNPYPCQFVIRCTDPKKRKFRIIFEWPKDKCIHNIVDLLSAHDQVARAKRGM